MDYSTEVINISKIKEGFYIGDQIAATNLEVLIQFKLTHMINATGSQVINQWESIGIKYLTLNWSEDQNQNLFDSKDEIASRIVQFVDDSFIRGEGLLAHSVRGQNRVCIVVLIYLMKKFKWNVTKSMEYLRSKKQDVDIPNYFLNQVILFENRLLKKGDGIRTIPWSVENLSDPEEKLLRNTYVNGLISKASNVPKELIKPKAKKRIGWVDIGGAKNEVLAKYNPQKDLFLKNEKNIHPVTSHKRLRPSKSSIKNRSYSYGDVRRNDVNNNNLINHISNNMAPIKAINMTSSLKTNNPYNFQNNQNTQNQKTLAMSMDADNYMNLPGNISQKPNNLSDSYNPVQRDLLMNQLTNNYINSNNINTNNTNNLMSQAQGNIIVNKLNAQPQNKSIKQNEVLNDYQNIFMSNNLNALQIMII